MWVVRARTRSDLRGLPDGRAMAGRLQALVALMDTWVPLDPYSPHCSIVQAGDMNGSWPAPACASTHGRKFASGSAPRGRLRPQVTALCPTKSAGRA